MKLLDKTGSAVLGSAAVLSMCSYFFGVFPAPYNSVVFGGGVGLITATAVGKRVKDKLMQIGAVAVLPCVPAETRQRSNQANAKRADRRELMRSYDRAFFELQSPHDATGSRSEALEKLRVILFELSPELRAWTGDVRVRIHLLMHELLGDVDDPSCLNASLDLLVLILSKGGGSALEMARPIFREKILKMYREPGRQGERFLPRVLLMLDDYAPEEVEGLARDAIHTWGDDRFLAASGYLGFEELRQRGLRDRLKRLLGGEIARAGVERDAVALRRAIELYHEVR